MSTRSPDSLSGTTLHERYVLGRRVRSDASGTGYTAHDLATERTVVVTVMHPHPEGDESAAEAFLARAQALADVSGRGLAATLGHGRDGEYVYSVTEFASGETLTDVLHRPDQYLRYSPATALSVVADVLQGLDATHRAGLTHGAISTDMIVLDDDGRVRLTGFTLLSDAAPDTRVDVHDMGVVLHTLMTGAAPANDTRPLRPSASVPEIPPDLDMLVANATEPNPRHRPRDAGHYLAMVDQVLRVLPGDYGNREAEDTRPIPVVPPPGEDAAAGAVPFWKRVPVLVGACVLVLALFAGGWAFVADSGAELPDLVGSDPDTAASELAALELDLDVSLGETYSDDIGPGDVAETTPEPGSDLEEGDEVVLHVSDGPQHVDVPDVAGGSEGDARTALREAGFGEIDVVQEHSADHEPGTVLSTAPEAGEEADREEPVTVNVSEGVIVPELVGMGQGEAGEQLDGLDLVTETVQDHHETAPEGEVIGQTPEPGSILPEEGTVTLTVSAGPEEDEEPEDDDSAAEEEDEGADDDNGGECGGAEAWDPDTTYDGGDQVHFRGRVYEAQHWVQTIPPSIGEEWGAWQEVGSC
ncbi:PASTA domain-containing protein [Nocardiopsis sp. HNM0947]|uniref:PASTA domain-containing protein n=1 Tax=Nocardiopsis coralli TaxID=2772213 RepID=A0ABR9PEU1_9ACTN|nr:PASTA domain-containing protein [Nocardiopsis coralli]MBE3002368.1 PASTA domain-containing protein [Nocardiopsis coralli]